MDITTDFLEEFKQRMHITHNEDSNLKQFLSFSITKIKSSCGEFDIYGEKDIDLMGKELVFERTRYAYNDALEYFDDNFLSQITSLGLSIALKEGDPDAAV
ncbi:phage gp6-like head-tail connector protein [Peribacillus simplex]|uniref:phage gp6-like head-tail connector protein n=1 Tax=Peribacillus simplex TaxID=1478 RepID=UPI000F6424AE|nr:phage gp6-like head-tail connector protein [Peribacillus simplex]RRN68461.1 phage gp6-like head-tail connector protein [Peribacillus simplex]